MNYLKYGILGLVQGLTEFLPVSSSGHLAIFKEIHDRLKNTHREQEMAMSEMRVIQKTN